MDILKLKIPTIKLFRHRKWKRNLRLLNAFRPSLLRSEYIERLVEKGYELKRVKVVYNVINDYLSLDEFSMYPEDNINCYLREKTDFYLLIERVCVKLRIVRYDKINKMLESNLVSPLTVMFILDNIREE